MSKLYLNIFVILLINLFLFCEKKSPEFIKIDKSGTFIYKGTATFPTLYFKSQDGMLYQVVSSESAKLSKYQGKTVRIKAMAAIVILESADHKYKQKRDILKNIVVTSTE